MRHGSLFSGIGGFDLAAQWMGWENVFQVEIDPFCQAVLKKNFPQTQRHGDIKTFDGTKYRGTIDVLSGGFPCQKFSLAGKGESDLGLWNEMYRIVGEIRPSIILVENVYGLIVRKDGVVFESLCTDLENAGYEIQPFIIPACAVNAPHKRDRVWIVAHSKEEPRHMDESKKWVKKRHIVGHGAKESIAYAETSGQTQRGLRIRNEEKLTEPNNSDRKPDWYSFPTQSPICRRDDGIPNRVDRVGALGNGIVPQVAFEIFKAIAAVAST